MRSLFCRKAGRKEGEVSSISTLDAHAGLVELTLSGKYDFDQVLGVIAAATMQEATVVYKRPRRQCTDEHDMFTVLTPQEPNNFFIAQTIVDRLRQMGVECEMAPPQTARLIQLKK